MRTSSYYIRGFGWDRTRGVRDWCGMHESIYRGLDSDRSQGLGTGVNYQGSWSDKYVSMYQPITWGREVRDTWQSN